MSKALCHMTKTKQQQTIARRLKEKKGGLGYWAAVDALTRSKQRKEESA